MKLFIRTRMKVETPLADRSRGWWTVFPNQFYPEGCHVSDKNYDEIVTKAEAVDAVLDEQQKNLGPK